MTTYKVKYAEGKELELSEQEAWTLYRWLEQKLTGFRRTNFVEQNNPEIRKK